jgi:predicted nucleic acid-binding Zn ribbon protein
MKCAAHNSDAVAVCSWCGRALCTDCAKPTSSQRLVCSDNCGDALSRQDKAMELILQKNLQSARASALYYYLCGGLSVAASIGAWFYMPVPFLIAFTGGCGVIFIASGWWYGRIARQQKPPGGDKS